MDYICPCLGIIDDSLSLAHYFVMASQGPSYFRKFLLGLLLNMSYIEIFRIVDMSGLVSFSLVASCTDCIIILLDYSFEVAVVRQDFSGRTFLN